MSTIVPLNDLGSLSIETNRLLLRQFRFEDARKVYENWMSKKEVSKRSGWDVHKTIEDTEKLLGEWIAEYNQPHAYRWVTIDKQTMEPIGTINITRSKDFNNKVGTIGYVIAPKSQRQGFGYEQGIAFLHYMFNEVGIHKMEAQPNAANEASKKLLKSLGFTPGLINPESRIIDPDDEFYKYIDLPINDDGQKVDDIALHIYFRRNFNTNKASEVERLNVKVIR